MSNQHGLATVELIVTRGLPGSGKTTWAKSLIDTHSSYGRRIVRFNRDDFRRMALPSGYAKPDHQVEKLITAVRDAALEQWLTAGYSVILDDTNLRMRWARDLADIAARLGVGFKVADFTDVPLETCIARDAARGAAGDIGFVGEHVIRQMHSRFLASGRLPEITPRETVSEAPEMYVPDESLPEVFLCDMDGTAALLNARNPFDESCVGDDEPNYPVIEVVSALAGYGRWLRFNDQERKIPVVFMSGRSERCREETERWIETHVGIPCEDVVLHMRASGDTRPDHVVKLELFDKHIRHRYHVRLVLDDRNSVVNLWRSMGLCCLQVAEGSF